MKKCEYCGKEIDSYHIQYCRDTDCEEKALKFYNKRNSTENVFGIINIACVILIMLGLLIAVFSPIIGNFMVAGILLALAITVIIMPYAPENFYKKWKIEKTSRMVRIFGCLLIVASAGFACLAVYYISHPR